VGSFEKADLGKTSLDGVSPEKDLACEEVASLDGTSLEKAPTIEEVASLDDTSLEKAPTNEEVKDTYQAPVEASDENNEEESKKGITEEKHKEQNGNGGHSLPVQYLVSSFERMLLRWEIAFGVEEDNYASGYDDCLKATYERMRYR
jgi:hypothetical protein